MLTPEIIFEFKQFCRRNKNEFTDKEDLANEFMYEQKIYGEDIFYDLLEVEI